MNRNKKIFCICLAVLLTILFNVALLLIPAKATWIDASEHKNYTLSEETRKYVASIDEPITLYLLNADGSDTQLEYYLERFCQYNRNLTLKEEKAENCGELLERVGMPVENVAAYTLILSGEKRESVLKYSDLFYYETDNQTLNEMGLTQMSTSQYVYYAQLFSQGEQYADYYNLLLSESHLYFKGEAGLISMIEYVCAEIIPTHYILTGHGETDLSQTLFAQIAVTFGGGYQPLDLTASETVPADAASLLLFAPKKDYSAREIDALRSYVEDGGLLTVVTAQDQLSFVNLMSFLSEYGLSATASVVKQEVSVGDANESEEPTKELSSTVDAYVNLDHDAMASFDIEDANPMITAANAIHFTQKNGCDQKAILTSKEKAILGDDATTAGVKTLAASVEKESGAKLVWFTGADSFAVSASEMTGEESNMGALCNAYAMYLVRDWTNLAYESEVVLPESILYENSLLQMTSGGALLLLSMAVLVPLGIVGGAIFVKHRRKKA